MPQASGVPQVPASSLGESCAHARRATLAAMSDGARRIKVCLPLPPAGTAPAVMPDAPCRPREDLVYSGGMRQRFADALQPLVDTCLFEGMDTEYLGVLEDKADGMGVWSSPKFTAVAHVGDQTFPVFLKLLNGEYGSRVLDPGHAIVLINPYFTSSQNIGQPWEAELRQEAKKHLDDAGWVTAYALTPVRSQSAARLGVLSKRAHDRGWRLHLATEAGWNGAAWGEPVANAWHEDYCASWSTERAPPLDQVRAALTEAALGAK